MNKYCILKVILLMSVSVSFCQTKEQLKAVISKTDVNQLNTLRTQFTSEFLERKVRIDNFLKANPTFQKRIETEFSIKEIFDVSPLGEISYFQTSNFGAAITARADKLYNGGGLLLNIQGQGMKAYVWDGGSARTTHVEFPNFKVTSMDGGTVSTHPSHVTGTIVAQGLTLNLRGIAFNASADCYDWTNDYGEMSFEASNGMLVSNHSYWIGVPGVWVYGAYDTRARQFDLIANAAPFYLAVTAAGNDRDSFSDTTLGPYLSAKGGYNLVRGMQNAKNYLTVGAVSQVLTYSGASDVLMSSFSSWGPTDDGRIKPEIVTKGLAVRSTLSTSDTAAGNLQGTSMASPGIAGCALLLQQYYFSLNNAYMRAATNKGLILHTASEAGLNDGPDYEFGWGLVDTEKAAVLIRNKPLLRSIVEENVLNQNQIYTKVIYSDGTTPIMASVSWTDPAGLATSTNTVDPVTKNLVNDLDIRIIRNNTTTFFPWTLNPAIPADPGVRTADNNLDNFEKIQIDAPTPGLYTVRISHKGALEGGNQNYSLIVSGINQNLSNGSFESDSNFFVYPNPTNSVLNFTNPQNIDFSSISVIDIAGKEIKVQRNNNQIDVSNLQSGVYFIKFIAADKSSVKKFVKI
jgi:hypothetical protein